MPDESLRGGAGRDDAAAGRRGRRLLAVRRAAARAHASPPRSTPARSPTRATSTSGRSATAGPTSSRCCRPTRRRRRSWCAEWASTVVSWIEHHAARTPDRVALVDLHRGRELTYAELAGAGPRPWPGRSRTGTASAPATGSPCCPATTPGCSRCVYACALLGAIAVPLNWRLTPAELTAVSRDAEPARAASTRARRRRWRPRSPTAPDIPARVGLGQRGRRRRRLRAAGHRRTSRRAGRRPRSTTTRSGRSSTPPARPGCPRACRPPTAAGWPACSASSSRTGSARRPAA